MTRTVQARHRRGHRQRCDHQLPSTKDVEKLAATSQRHHQWCKTGTATARLETTPKLKIRDTLRPQSTAAAAQTRSQRRAFQQHRISNVGRQGHVGRTLANVSTLPLGSKRSKFERLPSTSSGRATPAVVSVHHTMPATLVEPARSNSDTHLCTGPHRAGRADCSVEAAREAACS